MDSSDTIMLIVHGAPAFTTQTSKVNDNKSRHNYTAYCHLELLASGATVPGNLLIRRLLEGPRKTCLLQ